MRLGKSKLDITPPQGVDMCGYARKGRKAKGIHDPLYVRAIVFEEGERKCAILSCDLVGIPPELVREVREYARINLGIEREHVLISATHTHSGPTVSVIRGMGEPLPTYMKDLREKVKKALKEADKDYREVKMKVGRGKVKVGINRRERTKEGVKLGLNPEGPLDEELGLISFWKEDEEPEVFLVNYACHPVSLGINFEISADYPGKLCSLMEKKYPNSLCLFLQGCCGDINPYSKERGFSLTERMAKKLFEEVERVRKCSESLRDMDIKGLILPVKLPLGDLPSREELKKEKRELEKKIEKAKEEEMGILEAHLDWIERALKEEKGKERFIPAEIQILSLGSVALVGIPGEVFSEIGMRIKRGSPFPYTFVIGYANGCYGYIPTREAFKEGGYEVEEAYKYYGIYPFREDVGEVVVDCALKGLKKIKEGRNE